MPFFGFLNVDKPARWSSRDVVNFFQRTVHPDKVGHSGTLDPLATGVLVVCIGPATRLVEYIQRMPKRYLATFLLGRQSETEDIDGNVTLLDHPPRPSRTDIETAAMSLIGSIEQKPPLYSAIRIGGKRAYQLARAGKPFDLKYRRVRIDSIVLTGYDYPSMELDISCGGGTYIRSIGRDLASALGTMAVMSTLRRMAVGTFRAEQAIPPDALQTSGDLLHYLKPPIKAVDDLPKRAVTPTEIGLLFHGQPICRIHPPIGDPDHPELSNPGTEWAAVDAENRLLAILEQKADGRLWPIRNFLHAWDRMGVILRGT